MEIHIHEDAAGNTGIAIAKVNWIQKDPDEPDILGDIDGDGEITINDIALMKLHLVGISELEGDSLKAADINGNGEIDISDMAVLKLILLGLNI